MLARMLTTRRSTGPTRSVCTRSSKVMSPSTPVSHATSPGTPWKETLHDHREFVSIPTGTPADIGCAPHAGCSFVGSAHLASSRHEQSSHGNGPDHGHEHRTVPGDLGGDDDRDDVPHGSPHDPHVYEGVRWQEATVSGLCPDLGLRQCVFAYLDAVRSGGLSARP